MDFLHLSPTWALRSLAGALAVAMALTGCSSSSKELRTPGQTAAFVVEVAAGEPYGGWTLASNASQQAAQAWTARVRIADLGNKLRDAPPLPPGAAVISETNWTCAMARHLIALGTVGGITSYDSDDVKTVTEDALTESIKPDRIAAMIHDVDAIPFRDLALATAVVCGPSAAY